MKKISFIALISVLLLGFNSCDSYLDINYDPNSPSAEDLTSDMIIPAVEMNIAATYAYTLHVLGAYNVEYYAQQFGTPNYVKYSQFEVSAENGSGVYTQLFQRALGNLNLVKAKAAENGDNGVLLQAAVLRAYAYQLLVDAYGEVPYTEAFDLNIVAPHYDEGQVIYEGVIKEMDDALAAAKPADAVAASYILPNSTAAEWIQFANALKLKMLTRMSGVKDVTAEIKAIIDEDNLPAGDIQIAGCWANASGQANPFFSEEAATWGRANFNIIGNLALIGTLQQTGYTDGRLEKWYTPNEDGVFQGSISGTNLSTVDDPYATTSAWCSPVLKYNTPVILLANTEVEFFIAEYYARQNDAANAASHYEAAVQASFETAGAEGAADYVAKFPYDQAKWQESIGVAKWLALAGINGFEGYTEARRLDYPQFGAVQGSDMYEGSGPLDLSKYNPGKLYTPFQRFDQVGDNKLLERFPYPESSTSRNSNAPEFPGYTEPIFWGK